MTIVKQEDYRLALERLDELNKETKNLCSFGFQRHVNDMSDLLRALLVERSVTLSDTPPTTQEESDHWQSVMEDTENHIAEFIKDKK